MRLHISEMVVFKFPMGSTDHRSEVADPSGTREKSGNCIHSSMYFSDGPNLHSYLLGDQSESNLEPFSLWFWPVFN